MPAVPDLLAEPSMPERSGVPDLPGSFGRNDDFGLELLVENASRILAEQRFC
jgi:hypothetical protein